eukprot:jgi/Ulvmu1/7676/UM038_0106.1
MISNSGISTRMNMLRTPFRQSIRENMHRSVHAKASAAPLVFRAQCHPGMEEVVAEELRHPSIRAAGIEFIPTKAGVDFCGASMQTAYAASVRLRAALRVLHLLSVEQLDPYGQGYDELYGAIRRAAPWHEFVQPGMSVAVELRLRSCTDWNHSTAAQQCVQAAIADAVRDAGGTKPARARGGEDAALQLFVTMFRDEVKVFRDVSGRSMHRRGYRGVVHRAALNEAAAAGVLLMAGWPALAAQGGVLVDCMCGSGTLLTEAALMAHGVAPGLLRQGWSLTGWHDFDARAWQDVQEAARAETARSWGGVIAGCDVHEGALTLAQQALQEARVAPSVQLRIGNCRDWRLPQTPDLVVTNPPWGRRLGGPQSRNFDDGTEECAGEEEGEEEPAAAAWADLGAFLKGQCPGAHAWILSGTKGPTQALRMKATRRYPLSLGGVDCRLLHYEVRPPPPAAAAADAAPRRNRSSAPTGAGAPAA